MVAIFSQILNMSMTGSVVILLVMLARLILKRSPKIFSYALWSVVLFRLQCPVAFTAPISDLDVVEPEQKETSDNTSIVNYIPATVNTQADFIMVQPEEQQVQVESDTELEEQLRMTPMHAIALAWAAGMAGMMLYSVVQYLGLRRKLVGSVQLKGNIYLADHIDTAFVVGLLQPRIYLPSSVPNKERYFILAHEQHHIRRFDRAIKLLAYLALCIHWFNPLVWLSFVLAGMDMEMSCDEAVIKKLGPEIRADYSASLLRLATHRKILSGMPLAFGEGDTKGRVLNMAKWKKPANWFVAICAIICLSVIVICALNPESTELEVRSHTTWDEPCTTGIDDLVFTYPAGLTSEIRDVADNPVRDAIRDLLEMPSRFSGEHCFIDNGVDFGGVIHFDLRSNREIQFEELDLPSDWAGLTYVTNRSTYPYVDEEYTLIKDGKDYIQLYLYTYFGRGYFIWFYAEQGNPVHKHAILESVELGNREVMFSKLEQSEQVSLGQFNITIPKGYGYHRNETRILEITKKDFSGNQSVIGCVTALSKPDLPMETEEDLVVWIEALGIDLRNNLHRHGVSYSIIPQNVYGDIFLSLQDSRPVHEEYHFFYLAEDIVYHLYFDADTIESAKVLEILDSIWIKKLTTLRPANQSESSIQLPEHSAHTSDVGTDMEMVQYGTLKMLLPSSFATIEDGEVVVLTKDSVAVGGIRHWNYPEFQPSDLIELKKQELGVPIGYMSSSSAYGDTEYEIFWDGNPDGLNEEHQFFIDGDIIYDVWYDQNQISDGMAERFLKTVAINAEPNPAFTSQELEALAKCKSVLDTVQRGSHHIAWEKSRTSSAGTSGYSVEYLFHDNDWLHITSLETGTDIEKQFRMQIDGKYFYDVQSGDQKNTHWNNGKTVDKPELPWLASYQWDESTVAYVDTLQEDGLDIIMLRIDEPFYGYPEDTVGYWVNFFFDGSGNFVRVELQADAFRNNDLWSADEIETIVSLDSIAISTDIQKEYQRMAQ